MEGGEGQGESEHEAPDAEAAGSHPQVTLMLGPWATSSRPSARKSQTMTNALPALQTKAPSLSLGRLATHERDQPRETWKRRTS